jgi:hypothetical protein
MPEIKDYDRKKKTGAKRRPHKEVDVENSGSDAKSEAVDVYIDESAEFQAQGAQAENLDEGTTELQQEKVQLDFYGSELIREKAPKIMELADTVADEWVHDGKFEGLPVGHPLAQVVAAKALRKAKDVEKKLEEKGVFALAKMGLDYVKSEVNKFKK